jgi:hypothetical protein
MKAIRKKECLKLVSVVTMKMQDLFINSLVIYVIISVLIIGYIRPTKVTMA